MGTTTFNQLIGMTSCLNELLQYKILFIVIYSYSRTQSAFKKKRKKNVKPQTVHRNSETIV